MKTRQSREAFGKVVSKAQIAADTNRHEATIITLRAKDRIDNYPDLRLPTSSHVIAHVIGAFFLTMESSSGDLRSAWAIACREADYVRNQATTA